MVGVYSLHLKFATREEIREGKKVSNIELLYQSDAECFGNVTLEIPPMPLCSCHEIMKPDRFQATPDVVHIGKVELGDPALRGICGLSGSSSREAPGSGSQGYLLPFHVFLAAILCGSSVASLGILRSLLSCLWRCMSF